MRNKIPTSCALSHSIPPPVSNRQPGYSIVEVLVAAALVVFILAAASTLALRFVENEEFTSERLRGIYAQEQAARLFRLGVSPNAAANYLLPDPNADYTISFLNYSTTNTADLDGDATNETRIHSVVCRLVSSNLWTNDMVVLRRSMR